MTQKQDNSQFAKRFAFAFANFDIPALNQLIAPTGEFAVQDEYGDDLILKDRTDYLSWLQARFAEIREENPAKRKLKFEFDTCSGCSVGCPVIYFEGAEFPRIPDEEEGIMLHGIMVDQADGKAKRILFCYNFKYLDRFA
ncbi:MAG: hypothetical protein V4616_11770 [Bacteroidota bacterium]